MAHHNDRRVPLPEPEQPDNRPGVSARADDERRVSRREAEQPDNRPDVRVARRAAETWGVLSIGELRECGLSYDAVSVRVRNGRLHRVHRGVYAVGHANPPLEGRFLAAVKACGRGAVLSHFAAAALWGLLDWDDRHPEVTVHGRAPRAHPGLRVHRTSLLTSEDVAKHEGIAVTAPARTLLDLAASLSAARASARRTSRAGPAPRKRAGHRRRPGARRTAPRGRSTRSDHRDRTRADAERAGGRGPRPHAARRDRASGREPPLVLAGRRIVPDFRWPAVRLVVEADGATWHEHAIAREDDADRQALLERHGERVLRVTWQQAVVRPRETLARLRAAGAPQGVGARGAARHARRAAAHHGPESPRMRARSTAARQPPSPPRGRSRRTPRA